MTMPKLPYMKFYVNDWHTDCQLAMCSLAARACWLELLCGMHSLDQSGVITGTADQIARICRCSCVEFVQAVNELKTNHVGEITIRNGVYTIVNRRMKREHKAGGLARMRQSRYQEKANARNGHENYMENAENSVQKLPCNSLNNNKNTENKREINGEKTPDIHIQIQNKERETMRAGDSELWQEAEAIRALHPKQRELRGDVAAIVEAVQREADKPGGSVESALEKIRAATEQYAAAVQLWPETKKRFITPCKRWFEEGCYLDDPVTWRQDDPSAGGGRKRKFDPRDPSTWD